MNTLYSMRTLVSQKSVLLCVSSRLFQNISNNNILSICTSRTLTSFQKIGDSSQSTIDASEVEFFTKMKDWWDVKGGSKALHSYNLLRVPFIRDGILQCPKSERTILPLKNNKILDVGCGGGILSEALARLGAEITGIDASPELIAVAEEHKNLDPNIADNKPKYLYSTIEEHTKEYSNHYDAVVASEVIEHVNNKELFIKSCIEVLKPGGRIFFTTPNRTRLSNWLAIFAAENILRTVPRGTHDYNKFITPNELTFLLERNNCHVEVVYGIFYHFLTNNWAFVNSKQLLFALQAVKMS